MTFRLLALFILFLPLNKCSGQSNGTIEKYSFKTGDPNGIGKYMGENTFGGIEDCIGARYGCTLPPKILLKEVTLKCQV